MTARPSSTPGRPAAARRADAAALVAHAADPVGAAVLEGDAVPRARPARAAGRHPRRGAHPALAGALRRDRAARRVHAAVAYAGRAMQGWASYDDAARSCRARDDGRRTLLAVHPTLLPGGAGALVGLAPRPASRGRPRP